ncbi:GIY-YIG nuclease family protein [Candidatus Wolfebacteria bacterium]|uniref:Excinuclease ABC subunit C n=1 Tax=Candidatus Wolfebacteria bacterium CG_4_10_14_0_2_um_filter_39_18 TaxID=1975061 RepID=A0A2M7TGN2_9BACT|nr:GIY-YIG nuclease family protein [Candidatus Wolfebacteria bacterium]NCO44578.1 GIY-YIG nuclease family protein [Candidatus Wolfebacteria bacterium]PIZ45257.1 MAG: excinuclease ABC subunit C [Candidatus Wolfebacteria bacterium CG_4_10_14_0_2_um_filter_39_18]
MWYVYVLQNSQKKWYIGSTKDLRKRILSHNSGKNKSTKHGLPWRIIYCEISLSMEDARAREKYLKSGMGRRYLKNRLKFFFAKVSNGVAIV